MLVQIKLDRIILKPSVAKEGKTKINVKQIKSENQVKRTNNNKKSNDNENKTNRDNSGNHSKKRVACNAEENELEKKKICKPPTVNVCINFKMLLDIIGRTVSWEFMKVLQ